jgi:hypothetical protein
VNQDSKLWVLWIFQRTQDLYSSKVPLPLPVGYQHEYTALNNHVVLSSQHS